MELEEVGATLRSFVSKSGALQAIAATPMGLVTCDGTGAVFFQETEDDEPVQVEVKGVTPAELMKATKRERPSRVLLGEMRDPEAVAVFVDEIMAGNPGSLSTIHGRTPEEAAGRLFNLFKSSPAGQGMRDETVARMIGNAVDFIIPVENDAGARAIGEVWFAPDAARRGETFIDLLRGA